MVTITVSGIMKPTKILPKILWYGASIALYLHFLHCSEAIHSGSSSDMFPDSYSLILWRDALL